MAQSIEQLKRESEQRREQLAETVELLRNQVSETAEDIRSKVSPEAIKAEVTDYIADKGKSWLESLKQQAMENPLQAVAAATVIAAPAIRLSRAVPVPLLVMGAGVALCSKTVRDRSADLIQPLSGHAENWKSNLSDQMVSTRDSVSDALSRTVDGVRDKASDVRSTVAEAASAAPDAARRVIGDNAAWIGGLGLALGAVLAASLPTTRAERRTVGTQAARAKSAAMEAVSDGLETAKDAAFSAADAALQSMSDAGLEHHASRVTENMADTLKTVTEDVVTTAFEPPASQPADESSDIKQRQP